MPTKDFGRDATEKGAFPRLVRLLVIEDDFGDYDAVARALRKMTNLAATSTRAKTLEAARKLMSQHSYDVLLIDYNLGVECGARLLDEIGGRNGKAAPILLTGLLDGAIHETAIRAGAISCISKSDLSPTLLETTIRCAMYTHLLEREMSLLVQTLDTGEVQNVQAMLGLVRNRMPWLWRRQAMTVASTIR